MDLSREMAVCHARKTADQELIERYEKGECWLNRSVAN